MPCDSLRSSYASPFKIGVPTFLHTFKCYAYLYRITWLIGFIGRFTQSFCSNTFTASTTGTSTLPRGRWPPYIRWSWFPCNWPWLRPYLFILCIGVSILQCPKDPLYYSCRTPTSITHFLWDRSPKTIYDVQWWREAGIFEWRGSQKYKWVGGR